MYNKSSKKLKRMRQSENQKNQKTILDSANGKRENYESM